MPPKLEASVRTAAAKAAGVRASVFKGVEWDNNTVAIFVLILFSILTDQAPRHVACLIWVNSLTSRVPFASITGTKRFLDIDPTSPMVSLPLLESKYFRSPCIWARWRILGRPCGTGYKLYTLP
jgi:hypothetical protein